MKKIIASLLALGALSACQTTNTSLKQGEVLGTKIGSELLSETRLSISSEDEKITNSEIERALYFSENGLTTHWYIGQNMRIRPEYEVKNRRDRYCRKFRHGIEIRNSWYNATAIACREDNVPWYLISNRWDRNPAPNERSEPTRGSIKRQGKWQNLSEDLSGRPADQSNDDFGPRSKSKW
jgi:surface antigen